MAIETCIALVGKCNFRRIHFLCFILNHVFLECEMFRYDCNFGQEFTAVPIRSTTGANAIIMLKICIFVPK